MATAEITVNLSDEFQVLMATRAHVCRARNCENNEKGRCKLKVIYIAENGVCGEYKDDNDQAQS